MDQENAKLENLRHEYTEVNNNRRHYSNLRFAIFSVYFAVLGGLVSVAFGVVEIKSSSQGSAILVAKIAGLLFTVIFFSFDILCELNRRHFGEIAKELEDLLGYRQFKTKNTFRSIYSSWAMYILLTLFWLASIFS